MSAIWSSAPTLTLPQSVLVGESGPELVTARPMPVASPTAEQVADAIQTELRRHPWTFTLVHGDIETPEDAQALEELNQVALLSHCLLMSQGHSDTTSWVFDEDGGRAACMAMHAIACTAGRFWWRCQTRFGGPR